MNDADLREMLREVADDVQPGGGLEAIRARTRRSRAHLWVPAGAALVAASVVAAVAMGQVPGEQAAEPGPGGSTSRTATPTEPSPTPGEATPAPTPTETPTPPATRAVAVYYVGDTPDGPRLYREFRRAPAGDPMTTAAVLLGEHPMDSDYSSLWPPSAIAEVSFDRTGTDAQIAVTLRDASYRSRPAGMTEVEAGLAVEQVIRTLQAAAGARAPVQFLLDGNRIDQVLGVPASEPLAQGSDLEVLAHVSITSPSEGQVVDNDDPLVVSGAGNSYEGNIVTRLQRLDGSEVIEPVPTIAGWMQDRLFPFEVDLDISAAPPGEYVVYSQTDDPSGENRLHEDTRRITVVD